MFGSVDVSSWVAHVARKFRAVEIAEGVGLSNFWDADMGFGRCEFSREPAKRWNIS